MTIGPHFASRSRIAWLVLAIVPALVAVTAFWLRDRAPSLKSTVETLLERNPDTRVIEPRISGGLRWMPFRAGARELREKPASARRGEAESPHMIGLVQLLTGDARQAAWSSPPIRLIPKHTVGPQTSRPFDFAPRLARGLELVETAQRGQSPPNGRRAQRRKPN